MRRLFAFIPAFVLLLTPAAALAQDRLRISLNLGQQASTSTVIQEQPFDRYFEQGSFTLNQEIPAALVYDLGATVRVWKALHAGAAVSVFENTGPATVIARVPHPLQFNKPRTANGDIPDATRRDIGQHIMVGWNISTAAPPRRGAPARGLDFTVFAGPSIFFTDQLFVTGLTLSLDQEVFPFDELAFPGGTTESRRETVIGYNAGVDMTWRFARHVGVGLLLRYSHGTKQFEPTGVNPVSVTVGGLQAGGGLRVLFNGFGSGRKPQPPVRQPPPPTRPQPPQGK
jgi:hypothetical protein